MFPETLSERIKYLREKNNLTYEEVGRHVGVGKSTVHKWETGYIANMKRDKIEKLAEALHTTPAYLMGWAEDPAETKKESPLLISGNELSEAKRRAIERILTLDDDEVDYLNRLADAALDR